MTSQSDTNVPYDKISGSYFKDTKELVGHFLLFEFYSLVTVIQLHITESSSTSPVFNLGDMSPPGDILTFPRGHEVGYGVQKKYLV